MDTLFIFIAVFLGMAILFKVPVAFSIGLSTMIVFVYKSLPIMNVAQAAFSSMDSFPFLAIPFFMLAGTVMEYGGISKSLLDMVDAFVGKVKGSLGLVTIVGSAAFGILTGSALATASAIGNVMCPEMLQKGYKRSYCAALIAASCFLGILIPPSIPGIMYGLSAGQKISSVWFSTVAPAILFVAGYAIVNFWKCRKHKNLETTEVPLGQYLKNAGLKTWDALGALLMPAIIFGGIYSGVCTPTEAGALSAAYGVLYYVLKKLFKRGNVQGDLWQIIVSSACATGVVCILCIFSNVSSRAITLSGVSQKLSEFIINNVSSPAQFLLLVNVVFLFMGMLLDINCNVLLMTPLLLPSAKAMGIDPIHFGAITLVNLSVGFMTPPFSSGLFMGCKIAKSDYTSSVKEVIPFIGVGIVVILLTTYMPILSTYLPSLFL